MKKIILFFAIIGIFTVAAISAYAHSGRTNQWGCHYDHRTGIYHCH
ncbi:YHYH domain-containing protein [Candidatus Avelusimicrobium luingense]